VKAKYDEIGIDYATQRKSDPRIAAQILQKLEGATRILNIGAGTGSYEPSGIDLVALEPSLEMIRQRSSDAHPVVQGSAESLPFDDNSFTHALTILSMHHWEDRKKAFEEINRVATQRFIALSWDPEAKPFWLTRDYFPEIIELDRRIFPSTKEFRDHFEEVEITPLLIPEDCVDGFLAAYWKRPSAYLDPAVRASISSFSKIENLSNGLTQLAQDIDSQQWHQINQPILTKSTLDVGYIIVSGKTKSV